MTAPQRKLTTILCADVQGYSRLMQADEEGTLDALRRSRDAMARLIAGHAGRVVNTWGDGVIAEFASVVEAVRAAIDIQNELAQHNAGRPESRRMDFRIGINLGDVIIDGDDLLGDGVNIAARLQTQAEPGGIVISRTVYDQVHNKMAVSFAFLGNLAVKNLAEEVPSYAVHIGTARRGAAGAPPPRADAPPDEPHPPPPEPPPPPRPPARPFVLPLGGGIALSPRFALFGLVAIGLIAINLLSWSGTFWAKWPILGFAMALGFERVRALPPALRPYGALGMAAAGITLINLFAWHDRFWAVWPLLGIALAAAGIWLQRGGAGRRD